MNWSQWEVAYELRGCGSVGRYLGGLCSDAILRASALGWARARASARASVGVVTKVTVKSKE